MRRADVLFLDVAHVEAAHAMAIARAGGSPGVRDRGLLESAVLAVRNGYEETLAALAASLAYGIAKNHAFVDGNKRAAFLASIPFLRVNGYPLVLERAPWSRIFEGVAAGTVSRDGLTAHLATAMGGDVPLED